MSCMNFRTCDQCGTQYEPDPFDENQSLCDACRQKAAEKNKPDKL